ncbi:MAG: tetratricopeptide repeat protein [Deltaproteobacteria bacterium]
MRTFLSLVLAGLFAYGGVFAAPLAAQPPVNATDQDVADARLMKRLEAQTGADKASLYQTLGFSYFRQQDFDRAFLYFNAATQANPRLYWSWYYMGLLRPEKGDEYFKKAIVAKRDFSPAYYWLGRHYGKRGAFEDAIRAFEGYLEVAWSDPNEHGRMDEVREYLKKLRQGQRID